jgi:uncharacterized membrane-anchored protein
MNRKSLILPGLVLALAVPTWGIVGKERLLATGDTVLLELAPVDPRSLIQGDYMRLVYAITRSIPQDDSWPSDGAIVVTLDPSGVATFVRRDDASPIRPGERRLRYRKRDRRVRVGTDAFYFEEGTAERYERARYGELKVDSKGNSVLVGMRDSLAAPIR